MNIVHKCAIYMTVLLVVVYIGRYHVPYFKTYSNDHLYVMYDHKTRLYKIGRSVDPERRLKELDKSVDGIRDSSIELVKVYYFRGHREKAIHKMLSSYQVLIDNNNGSCGTEWFAIGKPQLKKIQKQIRYYLH